MNLKKIENKIASSEILINKVASTVLSKIKNAKKAK